MKNIPIGISSFVQTIDEDYIYVDKTKEILQLVKNNKFAFFSRPRRFGKSLTLDTIDTLFTYGIEPYFKDTYIAGNNEDGTPRWNETTYPVIRLDFSTISSNSLSELRELFSIRLNDQVNKFGISPLPIRLNCAILLEDVIKAIHSNLNKNVILLIDEYDAPLNALIEDIESFESIRKEIRDIYASIKSAEITSKIRFMLVTGITRFKDVSIFSAGTNISDISYDPDISTIVGYTKDEIELYFKDYIDIAIEKLNNCKISEITAEQYQSYKEKLLDTLTAYYDNICFDSFGRQSVYSTWSTNYFFSNAKKFPEVIFGDYWYQNGGIPSILVKYLNNHLIDFEVFNKNEISIPFDTFNNPTTLQSMDQNVLMAQCGYLSLKKGNKIESNVKLVIPNLELRKALSRLTNLKIFGSFFSEESNYLKDYLSNETAEKLVNKFNEILAKIPRSNKYYNFENEHQIKTVLQMFILGAGIACYREVFESKGIPDLVIEQDNRLTIVEFKYTKNSNEVEAKLQEGVEQILSRDYGASFDCNKDRLKFTAVYDANERKLVAFKEC